MVDDPQRTKPLLGAIKSALRKGDTVLDIGTGLGGLAIAAAKAGAARVFAIDCDVEALDIAYSQAKEAKVASQISFIEGLSFDLDLARRADLIVCETVGSFAFDENILSILSDARQRLLAHGGRIIPLKLELWGAPLSRMPRIDKLADIARVKIDDLMSSPRLISSVDFRKKIRTSIHAKSAFRCLKVGKIRAFAFWPRVTWWKGRITDASPLARPTHWKQGIATIEARHVAKGDLVGLEMIIRPHPKDPRTMTERLWRWVD